MTTGTPSSSGKKNGLWWLGICSSASGPEGNVNASTRQSSKMSIRWLSERRPKEKRGHLKIGDVVHCYSKLAPISVGDTVYTRYTPNKRWYLGTVVRIDEEEAKSEAEIRRGDDDDDKDASDNGKEEEEEEEEEGDEDEDSHGVASASPAIANPAYTIKFVDGGEQQRTRAEDVRRLSHLSGWKCARVVQFEPDKVVLVSESGETARRRRGESGPAKERIVLSNKEALENTVHRRLQYLDGGEWVDFSLEAMRAIDSKWPVAETRRRESRLPRVVDFSEGGCKYHLIRQGGSNETQLMQKNTETGKTRTVRVVPYPLDTRKSLVSLLRLRSGTWSRVTITHNRKALKEAWILDSNWYQRQMLDIKVRELKSRGYSTERQLLYHGCNATVAMDIALSGYHDMGSKNGRLWGHGVYFTSDVNLALDINYATPVSGIQTVLFCDVLVVN
uniref:PARP catalytic domain-containing protein n=3 Tax=Lotharella globosa TaxID=91324 RepID=A0A7S3YWP5_9EUKA